MNTKNLSDDQLAKILWDYNFMQQKVKKADIIVVLGSSDIRGAQKAAELFKEGYAPYILFTGGLGKLTKDLFNKPEAEAFAEEAKKFGVPERVILVENKSTNTGENIEFSKKLLEECELDIKRIILVTKPYMLRRSYATFMKQWPSVEFIVTAPDIKFADYPNKLLSKELVINLLVGDTQRVIECPKQGYQTEQKISDDVLNAYEELIKRGYTKHLIHLN